MYLVVCSAILKGLKIHNTIFISNGNLSSDHRITVINNLNFKCMRSVLVTHLPFQF